MTMRNLLLRHCARQLFLWQATSPIHWSRQWARNKRRSLNICVVDGVKSKARLERNSLSKQCRWKVATHSCLSYIDSWTKKGEALRVAVLCSQLPWLSCSRKERGHRCCISLTGRSCTCALSLLVSWFRKGTRNIGVVLGPQQSAKTFLILKERTVTPGVAFGKKHS